MQTGRAMSLLFPCWILLVEPVYSVRQNEKAYDEDSCFGGDAQFVAAHRAALQPVSNHNTNGDDDNGQNQKHPIDNEVLDDVGNLSLHKGVGAVIT